MTLKLEEGQVFRVPLNDEVYALGVAARLRRQKRGKAIGLFAYFFGPFEGKLPISQIEQLKASNAVMRIRCSALYLHDGRWQIAGSIKDWSRDDWPLPVFYRDDLLRGTVLIRYDDNLEEIDEIPYYGGDVALTDRQSVAGALAVEIMLRQRLNIGEPSESP
jgi:hypothetical protein